MLEVDQSEGLGDLGSIKGSLAICLLTVFILVYFSLWKGVKSAGKVRILEIMLSKVKKTLWKYIIENDMTTKSMELFSSLDLFIHQRYKLKKLT